MAEGEDTMRPDYDLSRGIRGITAQRCAQGANTHAAPAANGRNRSASASQREHHGTINHERVNSAIHLLRNGLAPFVACELRKKIRVVQPDRLHQLAGDRNLAEKPIDDWDALALLKLMEATWDSVFRNTLGRIERGLVSELREWRNRWAHQVRFSNADAERTLDSAERLLAAINAPQARELAKLRDESRDRLANEVLQVRESKHFVEPSEDMVREIRAARHQSWKNLRKAARALLDLPHEPFGTANVAASSKSTVRTMQRVTGMSLDRLLEMLDSM